LTKVLVGSVAVALLAAIDITSNIQEDTSLVHVSIAASILMIGCAGAFWMLRQLIETMIEASDESIALKLSLEATAAEAERWRSASQEILQELRQAMDGQFDRWHLSTAEKEVAFLLLKGLSCRDIAALRWAKEAATQHQIESLYRKAGLDGGNNLSSFFLEDLTRQTTTDGL
jgi:DNA-binding CsgD family transcriptional regulator